MSHLPPGVWIRNHIFSWALSTTRLGICSYKGGKEWEKKKKVQGFTWGVPERDLMRLYERHVVKTLNCRRDWEIMWLIKKSRGKITGEKNVLLNSLHCGFASLLITFLIPTFFTFFLLFFIYVGIVGAQKNVINSTLEIYNSQLIKLQKIFVIKGRNVVIKLRFKLARFINIFLILFYQRALINKQKCRLADESH